MARLAWFSPMPPVRSGIARCSADLIPLLRGTHDIDVFVDEPVARRAPDTASAHEFLWRHHRVPYDLTVYQLGNSSHHDYLWPYLFRYPGLTVLHDVHLHHARAAALLRQGRAGDYRAELAACDPAADPNLAELAVAGFDSPLFYAQPMVRLVARASRLTAVHTPALAAGLGTEAPGAPVEVVRLGHGVALTPDVTAAVGRETRARYGLPPDAIVFGCFGAPAPEKRIPEVLDAVASARRYVPYVRLLLAGGPVSHYDAAADVRAHGLDDITTLTGYVDDDDALTAAIAACDVSINLRWPTAREISGPWLRSLALARATVLTDLAHLADVPTVDPRTWQPNGLQPPVAVAIDITDEAHSLRVALRRLATDSAMRLALGRAGARYWTTHHSLEAMRDDYRRAIGRALALPAPTRPRLAHLAADGTARIDTLLAPFGLPSPLR